MSVREPLSDILAKVLLKHHRPPKLVGPILQNGKVIHQRIHRPIGAIRDQESEIEEVVRVREILHVGEEEGEDRGGITEGDAYEDLLVSFPAPARPCGGGKVKETDAGDVFGEKVRGVGVGRVLVVRCGGDEARDGVEDEEAEEEQGVAHDGAL